MKKTGIVIIALSCALMIFAAFIKSPDPIPFTLTKTIPDSVWTVVQKSCYDCHSNDGNSMAKSKVNFDGWNNYSSDKQLSKAKDMCKMLQKGKMPPAKYRNNNPEAVPTETDITRICNWVNQLGK